MECAHDSGSAVEEVHEHGIAAFLRRTILAVMNNKSIALVLAAVLSAVLLFGDDKRTAEECLRILDGDHKLLFFRNQIIPQYRDAAFRLVEIGEPALPLIERNLDALERSGSAEAMPGTPWILYAFARISRVGAFGRLWRLLGDERFRWMEEAIEGAIAVSLNLTSFRSSAHSARITPPDVFKNFLPQDSLDQAFLAWMLGDRAAFTESLSRRAQMDFDKALNERSWENRRRDSRFSSAAPLVGFGYRLKLSEPSLLRLPQPMGPPRTQRGVFRVNGVAEFHEADSECRGVGIAFVNTSYDVQTGAWLPLHYAIDTSDVETLLRSLARCVPTAGPSARASR
jgi:hypothetical protein